MPNYQLKCQVCGNVGEEYHSLSEWEGLGKNETPFSKRCPKCKSKKYYRVYDYMVFSETSPEQRRESLKKQIAEDNKRVAKGDMDFIQNIAGDKPVNKNLGGQKYLNEVRKGIRRK